MSVKVCVAAVPTPLLAVIVKVNGDPLAFGGVPVIVAVFAPALLVSSAQDGNPEPTLNVEVGEPVAVTVNVPALPMENVTLFALVIAGATAAPPRRMVWLVVSAM